MATKTKAKAAAGKAAAGSKTVPQSPRRPPPKAKASKKKVEIIGKTTRAPATAQTNVGAPRQPAEKPELKQDATHRIESVSLTDEKNPRKQSADGEITKQTAV